VTSSLDVDADVAQYALRLGDDALVLAQRLGEWATRSPEIEEDLALLNIGLDLLGQARTLYTYAGRRDGTGRSEDDLAFLRDEPEFRNVQLVELVNGDFAHAVVRQTIFSTYQVHLYRALARSTDELLAALAAKAVKEVAFHREHARSWFVRLGDGTEESHRRTAAALEALWPFAAELFDADELTDRLVARGVAVDPAALREPWLADLRADAAEATLTLPDTTWHPHGGRRGLHTEAFGYLLAELQHLHRSHPGATW
jgi:ring-1,2-phenylacetyl-CoA epoxidase subunit PaaC